MKKVEFQNLIENEKDFQKIIRLHTSMKISLTEKQLKEVIRLRDSKEKCIKRF